MDETPDGWAWEYIPEDDESIIYYDGDEIGRLGGQIREWQNGYPLGEAKAIIKQKIRQSGTPDRIDMQYELNFGITAIHSVHDD